MHWMIAGAVDIRYNGPKIDMEEALRKAWVEMRYKFPALGASVVDSKKVYETPDDKTLAAWLASSFRVHHQKTVEDTFKRLSNLPYITLNFFPSSNQLMITTATYTRMAEVSSIYLTRYSQYLHILILSALAMSTIDCLLPRMHSWSCQYLLRSTSRGQGLHWDSSCRTTQLECRSKICSSPQQETLGSS